MCAKSCRRRIGRDHDARRLCFWQQRPGKAQPMGRDMALGRCPQYGVPYRIMMRPGAVQFGKNHGEGPNMAALNRTFCVRPFPRRRLCYTIPTNSLGRQLCSGLKLPYIPIQTARTPWRTCSFRWALQAFPLRTPPILPLYQRESNDWDYIDESIFANRGGDVRVGLYPGRAARPRHPGSRAPKRPRPWPVPRL